MFRPQNGFLFRFDFDARRAGRMLQRSHCSMQSEEGANPKPLKPPNPKALNSEAQFRVSGPGPS